MIGNNRVIAIIPARGGSKSIPKKNLCFLNGKPLLAWTLEAAKKTDIIDRIIVFTDDKEIKREAIRQDCEVYKRPLKLSTDTSLVEDTVRYMYNLLIKEGEKCDIMLLLEVTSPFRTPYLIKKCVERLVTENLDSLATFNKADLNPQRASLSEIVLFNIKSIPSRINSVSFFTLINILISPFKFSFII